MLCPYCNSEAALVTGATIYPHSHHLRNRKYYYCAPCNAYVGTHEITGKPLGTLANKELRRARCQTHEAFDGLWKTGKMSRSAAYTWLAHSIGLAPQQCHIGMFNYERCQQVIELCQKT